MNQLRSILSYKDFYNIDNKEIPNIDNIDISIYALKGNFVPRTNEAYAATKIASALADTRNFAFYVKRVKEIGPVEAQRLLKETEDDIRRKQNSANPIRNPAALFNWKVTNFLNKRRGR